MTATDSTITLRDGRSLAISVSGPDDGVPFLYHHGTPGSKIHSPALIASADAR